MASSDEAATGPSPLLRPSINRAVVALLIVLGIECWLIFGDEVSSAQFQFRVLIVVVLVGCIPQVNRLVMRMLDRIRHPAAKSALVAAIVISILTACYFPFTAWRQHRDFGLGWQDEYSYALQIRMLSQGKLWMPAHPLADFFDSFQVIVKPVYASMYFPGASLFYVPAAWTSLPYWVISCAMAGICVGLIYLITTDLIDGVAGTLAALMLVGLSEFRQLSIRVVGHPAIVLLSLLMIYSWLQWRRTRSLRWIAVLGAFAGWTAITRPMDAVIIAIPIGVDVLLGLRGQVARVWMRSLAPLVCAAVPFLALQVIFNIGVTGSWRRTPFELYADRDYPGTTLGFHPFDPNLRPASALSQKQKFHDEWTTPAIQRHQPGKILENWIPHDLRATFTSTLPHPVLIILLPAGLIGLVCRKRMTVVAALALWIAMYSLYTWLLPHYALVAIPAMFALALLGAREIELAWPSIRNATATILALGIPALCLLETNEFNRQMHDQLFDTSELRDVDAKLAALDHKPAVVLFHFPPDGNPHIEPVYNVDVAWPDDAPVIRAQDLGTRNREVFDYYAARQPNRAFYVYDREYRSIKFLGFAKDLAHAD